MTRKPYIAVISAILAVMLAATAALNAVLLYWDKPITEFLGSVGGTSADSGTQYYASDYDADEERLAAEQDFAVREAGEGMVLLRNEANALPLAAGAKISLFGVGSVGTVTGGSGSGDVEVSGDAHTWQSSLTDAGFEVNQTLVDFYAASGHASGNGTSAGNGSEMGDWSIDEVPQSEFTDEVRASYADYHDAAVVVFARTGGEGGDTATEMSRHGGSADQHYLELSDEERELLEAVADAGFGTLIVAIKSGNPLETGFVNDPQYGVDACLWTAGTGENGIDAFGRILAGEINPSGHLVDTWAYDNLSSPAMQNFGDFRFVDESGELTGYSYVDYAEGVYVGYRYYETRYEDAVMGQGNAGDYDYATTVAYPFGYGLSYTDFDHDGLSVERDGDTVSATVNVTNTGDVAGKDAVGLYVQTPYTDYDKANGVEKPAVVLADFAKTDLLEPGASATLEFSFELDDIASYDADGEGTYILDAGDYLVTAAGDAHEAVNNVLAGKGYGVADGMTDAGNAALVGTFAVDALTRVDQSASGGEITNQFDDAQRDDAARLSRTDWSVMDDGGLRYATGTKDGVSEVTDADGTVPTVEVDAQTLAALQATGAEASGAPIADTEYPGKDEYTYGADNGVELIDLQGKDYDDPLWDDLLDEMKLSEMHLLFGKSGYGSMEVAGINKPKTYEYDGPAGISNFITGKGAYSYPAQIMLASTWNKDLAAEYGSLIGEDALNTQTAGWYAPAMNLHRTPFGGRNYEYYAEDPMLSGAIAVSTIEAVQRKGVYVYIKHFVLNDQDTNRNANGKVSIWADEQAIRELYLRPFQTSVEDGGAQGIMASMVRIGARQCYGHYNLLTNVVRGEWGFDGVTLTDYDAGSSGQLADQYLAAGLDLFLATSDTRLSDVKQDWCRARLRESMHRYLYVIANSLAMNGMSKGVAYDAGIPVYRIILLAVDALVVLAMAWGISRIVKFVRMSEAAFAGRARWSRRTKLVVWGSAAVVVVALAVVFCVTLLPTIQSALLI